MNTSLQSRDELAAVQDVDLTSFLVYTGVSIVRVTMEAGRVAFHFPAQAVTEKRTQLASGKARVEPSRWSSIVRQLHQDYLSPAAKAALRSRTTRRSGHE